MSGFSFNFQIGGQSDSSARQSAARFAPKSEDASDTIAAREVTPPTTNDPFASAQKIALNSSFSVLIRVYLSHSTKFSRLVIQTIHRIN
jgi:hypothetical protein